MLGYGGRLLKGPVETDPQCIRSAAATEAPPFWSGVTKHWDQGFRQDHFSPVCQLHVWAAESPSPERVESESKPSL